MSWSQDYSVPNIVELLESLTGRDSLSLLEKALALQGIGIAKIEDVLLADGDAYGPVMGKRVTLSNGRVYIPKLVEQYTEHGNYGRNTYEYFLEEETPNVQHVDGDELVAEDDPSDPYYGGCDNCDGCEQGFGCEYSNEAANADNKYLGA